MPMRLLAFAASVALALPLASGRTESTESQTLEVSRMVDAGGYRLHFLEFPAGKSGPTIVFESGGGDSAEPWRGVAKQVHEVLGVHTIRYDRAGLGESEKDTRPYSIDGEADALDKGLADLKVSSCVILVAHSYGGFVSTLFAANHPGEVCGLVLVDADIVGFFDDAEVTALMAGFREERNEILAKNPALVRALDAFPATVARMRRVELPRTMPVIDIVSTTPPMRTDEERKAWRAAHIAFVNAGPARRVVLASHSSHMVMNDEPDLIVNAIAELVRR